MWLLGNDFLDIQTVLSLFLIGRFKEGVRLNKGWDPNDGLSRLYVYHTLALLYSKKEECTLKN